MYTAEIIITPMKELLDPQGKAVEHGLQNMSLAGLSKVRIGKFITIQVEATSENEAKDKVEAACKKLLANPVMENYSFTIKQA